MFARIGILTSLRGYRSEWLGRDAMAGLAVAAVAIPSSIAYPSIAGLPPEVGIYSSILSLAGYALLGPSRLLAVGPDAATMTVIAATLANTSANVPAERVTQASALALAVGIFCIVASKLRFGIIAAFLSKPILVGFISGVSISILIGQIGRLTGLRIEAEGLFPPLIELVQKAGSIHWPSVAIGAVMFVILHLATLWRSPIPGPLIVVVIAIAASGIFGFEKMGVKVAGDMPGSLPSLSLPNVVNLPLRELLVDAAAVWLVSFGSGIVAARSFGIRGKFEVDADAELVGFGAANIASGLFSGFPVTVSDSRTATNMAMGARSQMSGLVAALALTVALLYLKDALRLLPVPALGAILVAAAIGLIDLTGLRDIWRISRMEFVFALIGMWGPISLGVLRGVVIAVAATLLYLLLREMRPRDAMLGVIPGHHGFYKMHRSNSAQPIPGLAICLIEGNLLFFNVDYVKSRLRTIADGLSQDTSWFVLDASAIVQVDSTAAAMLDEICSMFDERGIAFGIAELHSEAMSLLRRAGLLEKIGKRMIFEDLEEVPAAFTKAPRQ